MKTKYNILYAGFTLKGFLHQRNEDNLYAGGLFYPALHEDDCGEIRGICRPTYSSSFAVFDGMNGEERGETASYLAAQTFAEAVPEGIALNSGYVCNKMHKNICLYGKNNDIISMGSTAASLSFASDSVRGFHIGDSCCFLISGGLLQKLTSDQIEESPYLRENGLTDYLGMPGEHVETETFTQPYREGDIYMLATDGVIRMLTERRLQVILSRKASCVEKSLWIRELLLKKGCEDNATALIFEIKKASFFDRLRIRR